MAQMLEISTNNLKQWKEVKIDGHVFKVRPMGAGDRLDISQYSNRLMACGREMMNIKSQINALKELDANDSTNEAKINKLMIEIEQKNNKLLEAQEKVNSAYLKMFDDETKKQNKSKELLNSVGIDGLNNILKQVFDED